MTGTNVATDPTSHHTIERLATLDARVNGLEEGIKEIATAVRSLSIDFKQGAATPWTTLLTGAGVLLSFLIAIGSLAYMPMREATTEVKGDIKTLQKDVVPRVEHERIWALQQKLDDAAAKRIDRLEDDFYRKKP